MKAQTLVVIGVCAMALTACSKSRSEGQPAADEMELSDSALDLATIPVTEDFEDAARMTIDEVNLDDQVTKLEKEVEADR